MNLCFFLQVIAVRLLTSQCLWLCPVKKNRLSDGFIWFCEGMSTGSSSRLTRAREVAEILIHNSAHNSTQSLTHYQSINTAPNMNLNDSLLNNSEYLCETLAAGSTRDGRISAVRRFFCLFVTFDVLFTTLLWILCFVVNMT